MARSKVTCALPPLATACRTFEAFRPGENHGERVRDELRAAIRRSRAAHWQPFYTMRDVAAHFRVSVPTVADAYRRLANEGLLVISRGSMTTVRPGGRKTPRARLTGVVAMPVWSPGFLVHRDSRAFYIECQREFQRHEMVGLPVFFEQEEELTPEFARQVCRMKPDAVLWRLPASSDRQTLEVIADSGTRVVTILDGSWDLPGASYRVQTGAALCRAFAAWQSEGLRRVIIPLGRRLHSSDETEVEAAARAAGLAVHFEVLPAGAPAPETLGRLESLAAPSRATGVVFLNRPCYWALWFQHATPLAEFLARRPTLLLGEFEVPYFSIQERGASRIVTDWQGIARSVASDIARGTLPSPRQPMIFEAAWQPSGSRTNTERLA